MKKKIIRVLSTMRELASYTDGGWELQLWLDPANLIYPRFWGIMDDTEEYVNGSLTFFCFTVTWSSTFTI